MPFSFLLLPLFTMKYAWTESELNLNCPCLEAILLVWPPFGGIGLQVSGGGQKFSPRAGRTRSRLTCGLPVRILTHTRRASLETQAKRAEGRSVRRPCVRNGGFRSHTALVKSPCPLGVTEAAQAQENLSLSQQVLTPVTGQR